MERAAKEAENLNTAQIKYAATDAWTALKIYERLLTIDKTNSV